MYTITFYNYNYDLISISFVFAFSLKFKKSVLHSDRLFHFKKLYLSPSTLCLYKFKAAYLAACDAFAQILQGTTFLIDNGKHK